MASRLGPTGFADDPLDGFATNISIDVSWADRVDGDALRCDLECQCARIAQNGVFDAQ